MDDQEEVYEPSDLPVLAAQQEVAEISAFFKERTGQLFDFMGQMISAGIDDLENPDSSWLENLRRRKIMERRQVQHDLFLQNITHMEAMIDRLSTTVDKAIQFHNRAGDVDALRRRAQTQAQLDNLRQEVEEAQLRSQIAEADRKARDAQSDLRQQLERPIDPVKTKKAKISSKVDVDIHEAQESARYLKKAAEIRARILKQIDKEHADDPAMAEQIKTQFERGFFKEGFGHDEEFAPEA